MSEPVLDRRTLNRALLDRQLLLSRSRAGIADALERLVTLQGQDPMPPYLGLWSRLEGFDPAELGRMLSEREAVRITLMRGTIHLATVRDALRLRPLVQRAIDAVYGQPGKWVGEIERAELERAVAEILAEEPLGAREIARRLVEQGIGEDLESIGQVIPAYVALVQVPPRGVWGAGGRAKYATLRSWTGEDPDSEASIDDLVVRYLGAFGPASVMDMQNWSRLTRMKPVFERLRDRLVAFRDEDGVELFDLPDAPRPDPAIAAPVRLLGEYDNVLLGHRDRRRIIPEGFPWEAMLGHGRWVNNLLLDGMLRATWWIEREGKRGATLGIRPFGRFLRRERDEVAAEAERMLAFAAADADRTEVRFEDPVP